MKANAPKHLKLWQRKFFKELTSAQPTSERMGVYTGAYAYRIEQSLAYDFPRTRKALGTKTFDRLATSFVHERGSRRNLLGELSADFAIFLKSKPVRKTIWQLAECEVAAVYVKRRARERVAGELTETSRLTFSDNAEWVATASSLVTYTKGKITIEPLKSAKAVAAKLLNRGTTLSQLSRHLAKAKLSSKKAESLFTTWARQGLIHWS